MIFLGVDGGGTKTAFALISEEGKLLASTTQGPSHPDQMGWEEVRNTLTKGVQEVCDQAQVTASEITFSFWGLPGYGENLEHIPQFQAIIKDLLGEGKFRSGNDVEAGWAGSLACEPGVHLVAGTGAIGFGVDPEGNIARASGWSELFGDEGSAHWLGRHLLELFSKQSDGRMPKSPLHQLVKEARGIERDLDLLAQIDLLYQRREMAKLAQVAFEAAEAGDENAIALFKKAAYEHALTVEAIVKQLDFADRSIPVSYSGGVFKSGSYILEPLQEYLTKCNAKLVEPKLSPIMGSCLYALKLSGGEVTEQLVARLQEAEKGLD